MRFWIGVLFLALAAGAAEYFWPWWSIAVVCFLVALIFKLRPGRAFLTGFLAIGLLWLAVALAYDIPNEHLLSAKMAVLFHVPGFGWFMAVSCLVGALAGGLSALCGSVLQRRN